MKRDVPVVIAVIAIAAILFLCVKYHADSSRFQVVAGAQPFAYEIDKRTGEVWVLGREHKELVRSGLLTQDEKSLFFKTGLRGFPH